MIHGINFGHNRKWSAHSDMGLMEEARNVALPSLMRISSLAKSRVNRNGHAEFGPGEIASVLVIFDKKTGELKPMAKNQVANLIKQGKEAGIFDEESCARCIVICSRVVQRNTGTGSCKAHNINKSGNQIIEEEVVVKSEPVADDARPDKTEEPASEEDPNDWWMPSKETEEKESKEQDISEEEFNDWFESASPEEQEVAHYGKWRIETDALTKVILVAKEASHPRYNEWVNVQHKYSYAAKNVVYEGPARTKTTDSMEVSW